MLRNGLLSNQNVVFNTLPNTQINMGNTVLKPGTIVDLTTGSTKGAPYLADKAEDDFELMSV